MMTSEELKKRLRLAGIGGFLGRGLRIFDRIYYTNTIDWFDHRVKAAFEKLAAEGLLIEDYREDGADCDNWSMWIQSEVTKQWAIERKSEASTPALAFGRALLPGHDINIAVCTDGIAAWNYGRLHDFDLKSITEVEFK